MALDLLLQMFRDACNKTNSDLERVQGHKVLKKILFQVNSKTFLTVLTVKNNDC